MSCRGGGPRAGVRRGAVERWHAVSVSQAGAPTSLHSFAQPMSVALHQHSQCQSRGSTGVSCPIPVPAHSTLGPTPRPLTQLAASVGAVEAEHVLALAAARLPRVAAAGLAAAGHRAVLHHILQLLGEPAQVALCRTENPLFVECRLDVGVGSAWHGARTIRVGSTQAKGTAAICSGMSRWPSKSCPLTLARPKYGQPCRRACSWHLQMQESPCE